MKRNIFWTLLMLLFVSGCIKDNFEIDKLKGIQFSPSIAAPLVTAELSLKNIIGKNNSEIVEVDDEGFITMVFEDDLFSSKAEEILVLDGQSTSQSVSPGVDFSGGMPSGSTANYSETQTMQFQAGSNQFNTIYFKAGDFSLSGSSSLNADIKVTIDIPTATLNNVPFQQVLNLTPNGSDNFTIDLDGYKFDLTKGGTTSNELEITYTMDITGNGLAVNSTDKVDFSLEMTGMKYHKILGVIDFSDLVLQQDTVPITLFNTAAGVGNFNIVEPRLKFYSANSFGTSLDINFNKVEGINTISGSTYDLVASGTLPSPWSISGPGISQEGQTISDSVIITGADMISMINDQPKFLVYNLGVTTPSGGAEIFVLDTSKIDFNTRVELPLYGSAEQFVLIDTMNLDLGMESVQDIVITSIINNGFPIEFKMTVYSLKNNNNSWTLTDSAFVENNGWIAESGVINAEGRVTQRTETRADIPLDSIQTRNFAEAGQIIIKASAATTNAGLTNVKFYEDYGLEMKIGIIANIELDIEM